MINDLNSFQDELKAYLESSALLSYVETVKIRKYHKSALPDFDRFALIISPVSLKKELITNRQFQNTISHDIVAIIRIYHPEDSLRGVTPPDVGIQKFIEDLYQALFEFGEAQKGELDILYDEVEEVRFDIQSDREGFYHEFKTPYGVKLKPYTF